MYFVVGKEIIKEKPQRGMHVRIKTMLGDDVNCETITMGAFQEEDIGLLEFLIETLENIKKAQEEDEFVDCNTVDGFVTWFYEDVEDEPTNKFTKPWAYNEEHDEFGRLVEYNVVFVDENGKEFEVEIEPQGEL